MDNTRPGVYKGKTLLASVEQVQNLRDEIFTILSGLVYEQATIKTGYNINFNAVRAEQIPQINSLETRNAEYLTENTSGTFVIGGIKGKNYTNVLKYVNKAYLKVVENTNNKTYKIVDKNGTPIKDWVSPSDAMINQSTLSNGYAVQLFTTEHTIVEEIKSGWTFDYYAGLIYFSDSLRNTLENKIEHLFITGITYIGKNVKDLIDNINVNHQQLETRLSSEMDDALSIKSYIFSTNMNMKRIGTPYQNGDLGTFQKFAVTVPGICFKLVQLETNETILTEMKYHENGTNIYIDLPFNTTYSAIIKRPAYVSNGEYIPDELGHYEFKAFCFDSEKIGDIYDSIDETDYRTLSANIQLPFYSQNNEEN